MRCLDDAAWHEAPDLVKALLESVASAYNVVPEISYQRNVPPTVNEAISTAMFEAAADRVLGPDSITEAPQSLGGEDFAWYLDSISGALARLGTRTPGSAADFDIHQADVRRRRAGDRLRRAADGGTALTAMLRRRRGYPGAMPGATASRDQIADAAVG